MKTIGKLIVASVAVVSLAAPALAIDYNSDSFILQERGAAAAPQSWTQTQGSDWTNAYASEGRVSRGYAVEQGVTVDGSSTAGRGAEAINGGN